MVKKDFWRPVQMRFSAMTQIEKLSWLSQLLYVLSMLARDTYEVGTDDVARPADLRRFNELIHRVATFQKKVAKDKDYEMPEYRIFRASG
ncbi:hypothetical protein [Paraherbaspirillum soli]|uniref:Uncharacterized protein n=1 Tax=Paraherbaspirillum soli TaxID=631222 RepID=A0ABW0MDW1_9BURK